MKIKVLTGVYQKIKIKDEVHYIYGQKFTNLLLVRFAETENKDRKIRKDILHTKKKEVQKEELETNPQFTKMVV